MMSSGGAIVDLGLTAYHETDVTNFYIKAQHFLDTNQSCNVYIVFFSFWRQTSDISGSKLSSYFEKESRKRSTAQGLYMLHIICIYATSFFFEDRSIADGLVP